jgi:hypothetical protein
LPKENRRSQDKKAGNERRDIKKLTCTGWNPSHLSDWLISPQMLSQSSCDKNKRTKP